MKSTALGRMWLLLVTAQCLLTGFSAQRANETMQTICAVVLYAAASVTVSAFVVPVLQDGFGAALRVAFASSALLFRGLSLVVVGSQRLDRTSELLGTGTAAVFAAAVVLVRIQFEAYMVGGRLVD